MRISSIILGTLAIFVCIVLYGTLIEPNCIVVRHVDLPSPSLNAFFGDATVVHISDFQLRRIGFRERRLKKILERIDPDYVFITGDFSQADYAYEPVIEYLSTLPAREGMWGILGNTDYNRRNGYCLMCHTDRSYGPVRGDDPIRILRNEMTVIVHDGKKMVLVGLDEFDARNGGSSPEKALTESPPHLPRIVLAHTPFLAEQAAEDGVELYLAGDTHGGQVRLPSSMLIKLMPDKWMQYRAGPFSLGAMWLHVNPGIGWNSVPVRIACPPEVTVLHFEGNRS